MIATILPKSSNFHAVLYNERKVEKGVATLLVKENISGAAALTDYTPEEMQRFFIDYSSRNSRIRYPQFHAAISCRGHEYTEEELVKFARRYLTEMGYGETGQPLLIYAHRDTDNTHVHIVTSRVTPQGKKIDHNHERRRSQTIVDSLMNKDVLEQVNYDVNNALHYTFYDVVGFQCIMQSMGYECYKKADTLYIKRNGAIQKALSISEVESHFYNNAHPDAWVQLWRRCELDEQRRKLYGIFMREMPFSSSLDEFTKTMREYKLSLVFFGSKDNPTGYRTVDHANKCVLPSIINIHKLHFRSIEERISGALLSISETLSLRPEAATREINKNLRSHGAWIKDYTLHVGDKLLPLPDDTVTQLKANNKAAYIRAKSVEAELWNDQKTTHSTRVSHPTSPHTGNAPRSTQTTKGGSPAASHTVNRDNEIDSSVNMDSLEEQMRRQMKL